MIRFVVGPDGDVVPDIKRKLPGRGIWITGTRAALEEAVKRNVFARGFKRDVRTAGDLAARVESLCSSAPCSTRWRSPPKRASLVAGFAKVEAAIEQDDVMALIHAADAAGDGTRKLDAALQRKMPEKSHEIPIVTLLTGAQLDLALRRPNVVHAALLAGPGQRDVSRSCRALAALSEFARYGHQCAVGRRTRTKYGMSETKNPGEKRLGVGGGKLTLRPRTETGVVRQSFSHGRSKQVVVEKVKRRSIGAASEAKPEPAPKETARKKPVEAPAAVAAAPAEAPKPSGVVLRTLTEEERVARAHALADSRLREAEERKIAEEEAKVRASREAVDRTEREAADARKREEEDRRKHEEDAKRKAGEVAKKRFGEDESQESGPGPPDARSRRG